MYLEDWSQSEDGSGSQCFDKPDWRISTICRDGTTHGALGLVSTSRRCWLPSPGTSTERRQTVQDSHVGLATRVAERLSFAEMPQLLAQASDDVFSGRYWCDSPHGRHNNYVDSIKQAGLSFCRTEWSVVSNATSEPFDKAGFFFLVCGGCEGVPGHQRLHQRPLLGGMSNPH